jgi:hypothetical protein
MAGRAKICIREFKQSFFLQRKHRQRPRLCEGREGM